MHIVVTGASSGIGAALAREFHAAGAELTLIARRREPLEALVAELGARCHIIAADVTSPRVVLEGLASRPAIDIFVNNAGIQHPGAFAAQPLEVGCRVVEVDLLAPLALARAVLPGMLARASGVLVNVSSVAALAPPPGMAWYAAAKAGLAAFSEALRAELRATGVHVLTVYPGPIDNGRRPEAYALYGNDSVAGRLPVGSASALAHAIRRAVTARHPRVIFPRFYGLAWWLAAAARWLVSRGTPPLRGSDLARLA